MFIRHIFVTKPLIAIAILVCMGTIIVLFRLNRRKPQTRSDKVLIVLIGMLTVYEAMKMLRDSGVVPIEMTGTLNDFVALMVAIGCLVTAVILHIARVNHLDAESALRLARAAPPRAPKADVAMSRELSTIETLTWAVPKISDGAFKLLAVLCLRSDASSGRVPVGVIDMQLKLGKSKEDLDQYLKELQENGVVTLNRQGGALDIEIVSPVRRQATEQPARPPALATESRAS